MQAVSLVAPSGSLAALILMEVIYCSSRSFSFFFPSPIVDVSPALTCKLSVCHFAASGVHSFLSLYLSLLLLLLPSAVGWRGGGGEERRVEETVDFACSKYSLYVCGVLSSKERRDRGWFTSFVVVCACVSVCATVCLCN